MQLLLIDFPAFKPIAIEIGPFAIRWYALAYICGIVFGWLYARSLLKNQRLWGGPAPISLLSQHLPRAFEAVREGTATRDPLSLAMAHVGAVLDDYHHACHTH